MLQNAPARGFRARILRVTVQGDTVQTVQFGALDRAVRFGVRIVVNISRCAP